MSEHKLDTAKVKAFRVPAGALVEVYSTTLHYAPCHTDARTGFRVLVALPKGTNTAKPDIPAPEGDENAPLQALIFDSFFDSYKGVIAHIRVVQGHIKKGMKLKLMNSGKIFEVTDVG